MATVALVVALIGVRPAAQTPGGTPGAAAAADPCASPATKLIAENCKPGNPSTEWDINGPGDTTIVGFSTDISYNLGETARFKVRTDSAKYRVDIYRTGWYGGLGARLVASIRPSAALPQRQPECAIDWSIRLYDCGTWAVSAEWPIPADAVSGCIWRGWFGRTGARRGATTTAGRPGRSPSRLRRRSGPRAWGSCVTR